METIFKTRVALVTGGSFGIGRATAEAFVQRGANVVITDWKEDPEGTTLKLVMETGSKGLFLQCDVSNACQVKAMIGKIVATYSRLDYAFTYAGIVGYRPRPMNAARRTGTKCSV